MNPVEMTRRSGIRAGDSTEPHGLITRPQLRLTPPLLVGRFPTTAIKLMDKEFSASSATAAGWPSVSMSSTWRA